MSPLDPLRQIISSDVERMRILRLVRALELADGWVAAGMVRSAVWDRLHGRSHSPLPADIDVIWFDPRQADPALDARLEARLQAQDGRLGWSVKNQARMHLRNQDRPYRSATDAMRHWPETATAVAVRLTANDALEIAAPFGLDDLFGLLVRPGPRFRGEKRALQQERLRSKRWLDTWPRLTLADEP